MDRTTRELGGETNDRTVEVAWQTLTRLVYDSLAIRFDVPFSDLELGYWLAIAKTRRMAGSTETLGELTLSNYYWKTVRIRRSRTTKG